MAQVEISLLCILIVTESVSSQFNLYLTDRVSDISTEIAVKHNCLYTTASADRENEPHQIVSYCLSESPTRWRIEKNSRDRNFTFAALHEQKITGQQLYLWSAPMDLIERYQLYLNQPSNLNKTEMETEVFYNCTFPWFGPKCQYMFDQHQSYHLSFSEMVRDFYKNRKESTALTCYEQLQCNRGPYPACLDWSEICDGTVDCLDGGQDEEYCWQLVINDCLEDEYRCFNGQCIPHDFSHDDPFHPDCLDTSDEKFQEDKREMCTTIEPIFSCEDVTCVLHTQRVDKLSTSSCVAERAELIWQAILPVNQSVVPEKCWSPLLCITHARQRIDNMTCNDFCQNETCKRLVEENCPEFIYVPPVPILFGHVYLVYTNRHSHYLPSIPMPQYICYNDQLCTELPSITTLVSLNNATCRLSWDTPLEFHTVGPFGKWHYLIDAIHKLFSTCDSIIHEYSAICNLSIMYQCTNVSKCISKYQLNNGIKDCFYGDDEQFTMNETICSMKPFNKFFKCYETNTCIPPNLFNDGRCNCHDCEDELDGSILLSKTHISFQTICDNFIELRPIVIDGREETDETDCKQWQCNNLYTRCNGFLNCLNGADEINCNQPSLSDCTSLQHKCVSSKTNKFICLPIEQANDGIVDCLGGTDEPTICPVDDFISRDFYCQNASDQTCISMYHMCTFGFDCPFGDDEQFCQYKHTGYFCADENLLLRTDVETFLCDYFLISSLKQRLIYFSLDGIQHSAMKNSTLRPPRVMPKTSFQHEQRCHRGLDLRVWLGNDENSTTTSCLCPPTYYGDLCQYQNRRVSLTIQIRGPSDVWRTPLAFFVALVDDDSRMVHSHEQFTYLSARDCQNKFNVYLFYSTRSKNRTKNYSVHIDTYDKQSLTYRASWWLPLTFPFLPVHRLVVRITIPNPSSDDESCLAHQCVHGHCTNFVNNRIDTGFCRCDQGWTGRYCNISYACTCSSFNSHCVGVSVNNQSLCVCRVGNFGPRCLLEHTICQSEKNDPCRNGGYCVPPDVPMTTDNKFTCICPEGFSGETCETVDTQVMISFEKSMFLPRSILMHFIEVLNDALPVRVTSFEKIPIDQNSVTTYSSNPFHILFIELFDHNYYLAIVQTTYIPSRSIVRNLDSSHRCPHIRELFNETIVKMHLLRRIKMFHIPCRKYSSKLSCFWDETHFCLCTGNDQHGTANCFDFNHRLKHDCFGQSVCENGAQCFQDKPTCPRASMCVCAECFYGERCQFNTKSFGISLDAILGYHIRPHVNFLRQSLVVKVSMTLVTIVHMLGFIDGILTFITFKTKKALEIGCGFYLLGSSITSLLTATMLVLKFWLLILAQMGSITNRSFLSFQCISVDFLLRICLHMDQWLNACVATERTMTIVKGLNFNKKSSKQRAKWVILGLFILTIGTSVHDPIHRRLIDEQEDDEKRVWCIVTYSRHIEVFNTVIHMFHFIVPFFINLISAFFIIFTATRQRAAVRPRQRYQPILREQFRQHRRLIIAPCVLVVLAFPRLALSLISGCMKSARGPWIFLAGYFISFVPPMLTFVVFVLPSEIYKAHFYESIQQYRKAISQILHFRS